MAETKESKEARAEATAAIICSFCVKPTSDVAKMIAGPGVYICNECVGLCVDILNLPDSSPGATVWEDQMTDDQLLELLPKIAAASDQVDRRLTTFVTNARSRGITWTRIGQALSMTRQSAWERFSGEE